MIKFILAVIAMIFVGLAAYVYMNPKETDAPVAKVAQKTEKSIVKKEAPSVEKESAFAKVEVVSEKKIAEQTHSDPRVDEFGISHPTYVVDEEQILKEINGEARVELDKAAIRKIESEVKGETPKLDDATMRKIEAEVKGEAPNLDDSSREKIASEIKDMVF